MFKLAIFDLDGTLLNSVQDITKATNYVLLQYSVRQLSEESIRPLIGLPASKIFETAGLAELNIANAIEIFRDHLRQHAGDSSTVYPTVTAELEKIQSSGMAMAVATNKPTELAIKVLERSGLLNFFDFVQGATDMRAKPSPDTLQECMRMIGVEPDQTVMIGDSEVDFQAAKTARCSFYFIKHHGELISVPDELDSRYVVSDFFELRKKIMKDDNEKIF